MIGAMVQDLLSEEFVEINLQISRDFGMVTFLLENALHKNTFRLVHQMRVRKANISDPHNSIGWRVDPG